MSDERNLSIVPVATEERELSVEATVNQGKKIHELMKAAMQNGLHYGTIPGIEKPCLLKPGAEKIDFMFRLLPRYQIQQTELPGGHREYRIVCDLIHQSGTFAGQGVGSCSTMESKYRYRNVADFEVTGEEIPKDSKERKKEYRRDGYGMKKVSGVWEWVKYADAERTENPDIADVYNTVLKMAAKRAQVAATITATAASDIFAQDVEEDEETNGKPAEVPPKVEMITRASILAELKAIAESKALPDDILDGARAEAKGASTARLSEILAGMKKILGDRAKLSKEADIGFEDDDPGESEKKEKRA